MQNTGSYFYATPTIILSVGDSTVIYNKSDGNHDKDMPFNFNQLPVTMQVGVPSHALSMWT